MVVRGRPAAAAVLYRREAVPIDRLSAAAVLDYMVDHDETKIVATFTETIAEPERYVAALDRAAAAGKPVVVLKVTLSPVLPPATTSVAVRRPAAVAVIAPSVVSTFVKVNAPAPASTIDPAVVEDTSTSLAAANSIEPAVSVLVPADGLPPISA